MKKETLKEKLQKKFKSDEGFTLLEILVVLVIMGFLIAMVAPRLAGISGSAVDTVCDSNQSRMVTMMSAWFEQTNRFPSKMTNLVEQVDGVVGTDATFQIPSVSDDDPENGPETLASEFMSRNHFRIHYLDEDEAAELRNMGIVKLLNLNAYDAYNDAGDDFKEDYTDLINNNVALAATVTKAPTMDEVTVPTDGAGFAVAMVGMGYDDTAWDTHDDEQDWGEPDWFGRIVLGFGPENTLVTSGLVANAAHCPGGIQNSDNVTYNDYNLVLPRLEATAARFDTNDDGVIDGTDASTLGFAAATDLAALAAVAYDEYPGDGYVIGDNDNDLKVRTFDIASAQERWQYATQCPEGHMFPADDEEFWGIDINGDGNIN
ncbi:type II secretion system protein [Desulfofustis glycolicus]|uniref:Prepilin-type N-terminal cleavage/methylation domain-containing protein n=1 Tax=Desulfofustis glycolicus DSM 9705 TaxID=1121409 RepID=A0A1M5YMT7_9BACT|nr:prepilin-type N-terminal cleavage/methylation domain-containing protein [Desulfofustis glycolicus]SHI13322.1 prepilin-type N-terminal cleavage/methylation domain-containing protein [Desulfofustis glycolicus DSM 9705]